MQSYIRPARSRRIAAEKIADVKFEDDIALVIERTKLLLDRLEKAALSDSCRFLYLIFSNIVFHFCLIRK